jgi:site-specific DNA-methyltransferase (adenine-specific)/modification methylase
MSAYQQKVVIGDAVLYQADCVELLPTLGRFDACITDPPYGIGETGSNSRQKPGVSRLGTKTRIVDYPKMSWDKSPPSDELINVVRAKADWSAFFGGNYFTLPPSPCWLVWDKLNSGDFADCELVWTDWPKAVRRIQWRWNGMIRQGNEERHHPTQKPLEVMKWVIGLCPKAETILDPFAGSGTTGVAAVQMGRKFTGIERDAGYFAIACRRIEQAYAQGQLFEPERAKQVQEALV